MNEYMNHTQNNPKSLLSNANMPSNSAMPIAETKMPAQKSYLPPLSQMPSTSVMPMAETKMPGQKSYLPPLMQTPSTSQSQMPTGLMPMGMHSTDTGGQPMQFGTPSMQPAPQFGTASQMMVPAASLAGTQQGPPPVTSIGYIPGFLASIIGRTVRAEFIIGEKSVC